MPGTDRNPAPAIASEVTGQEPRDDGAWPPAIVFVTGRDE
jgi:hypothetical protein